MIEGRLLLAGAGNMGGAMLGRWLASGLDPAQVTVVTPSGRALPGGVRGVPTIPAGEAFDVVMLGMKPQQLGQAAPALAQLAPRLLLSILAGVEIATLVPLTDAAAVVRAMPNLPVALGAGVTALHGADDDTDARALAEALARPLGTVEWIGEEPLFDAVTALSGCGPAFLFRFIDALADAGTALGLPADQAMRLALATVEGSARMAMDAADAPAVLADRVASPGGSTRAGLDVLDAGDALNQLLAHTLRASRQRNAELAAAAR